MNARIAPEPDYDTLIVGAGFAGMYMLHRLRDMMGKNVVVVDKASDVGGTWYWNRYPGCRCDIPSVHYSYSFNDQIQQEWTWSERYAGQPEILAYARYVADKLDLRRSIRFDSAVTATEWDEANQLWRVTLNDEHTVTAQFVVAATGILSAGNLPDFPGRDSFKGETYFSGAWPHEDVDFTGKRVGLIGTGATGIQITPLVAKEAAQLTVFQRTPNFSVPLKNRPTTPSEIDDQKRNYREHRRQAFSWKHPTGIPVASPRKRAMDDSPEEQEKWLQRCWDIGGFQLWLGSYEDMLIDPEANKVVADFVRRKTRERVNDPEVADLLTPSEDMFFGARRLPCETNYFEAFNQDNVSLVDINANPIVEITESGIQAGDTFHELDAIIFATGFDAFTGPLFRMNVIGRNGLSIRDHWADGASTLMGFSTHGFPNLFMINGAMSPAALFNIPLGIERDVEWISELMTYMDDHGYRSIEADAEAEAKWVEHVAHVGDQSLMTRNQSWYLGSNIPGKPQRFLVYLGGGPQFTRFIEDCALKDYEGFHLEPAVVPEQLGAQA